MECAILYLQYKEYELCLIYTEFACFVSQHWNCNLFEMVQDFHLLVLNAYGMVTTNIHIGKNHAMVRTQTTFNVKMNKMYYQ